MLSRKIPSCVFSSGVQVGTGVNTARGRVQRGSKLLNHFSRCHGGGPG